MQVKMPFDPVDLVVIGLLQGLNLVVDCIWAMPFWTKALLVVGIAARIWWPSIFSATAPARRNRRRRHRHRSWED